MDWLSKEKKKKTKEMNLENDSPTNTIVRNLMIDNALT
jgi:hypothetical protein